MSNVPNRVNDGNTSTRWSHTMPTWIQMDVGFITRISYIKVQWYNAATVKYNFNVQISSTGADNSFVTVIEGQSTNSTELQTINFTDTTGRYVRVNVLSAVAAAAPVKLTNRIQYYGGPVFNRRKLKVWNIFWGSGWNDTNSETWWHHTQGSGINVDGPAVRSDTITKMQQIASSEYWDGYWGYYGKQVPLGITIGGNITNTATSYPMSLGQRLPNAGSAGGGAERVILAERDAGRIPNWDSFGEIMTDKDGLSPSGFAYAGAKMDYTNIYIVHLDPRHLSQQGSAGFSWKSYTPGNPPGTVYYAYIVIQFTAPEQLTSYTLAQHQVAAWTHELTHQIGEGPGFSTCTQGTTGFNYHFGDVCTWTSHIGLGANDGANCPQTVTTLSGNQALVPRYWSDMDGGCICPGSGEPWIKPTASTTIAGILELEVYGQAQTAPPPPTPPPGTPPPSPTPPPGTPPPPAPTPPAGSLDTDGVMMVMQKNMNPGKFHKNMKDLNLGNSWGDSTFFDMDADSSVKRTLGSLVYYHCVSREGSFASGGSNWTCRPEWVSSRCSTPAGVSGARSRGYLCSPDDPKNIEYTIICRVADVVNERDSQHNLTMKWRGDDHSDTNEKTLQGGLGLWYDDVPSSANLYHVEITHPDVDEFPVTFVSPYTASNHPRAPVDGWIGLKTIVWNVNNNSGLHAEMWIDEDPITSSGGFTNNWKKVYFKEDARNEAPIWGGPRQQFRIDMAKSLDIAAYSIHEIIPPSGSTTAIPTPSPSPSQSEPISLQNASKKNVTWVANV